MTNVVADMGANVWKIMAAVGDQVSEGDVLMVLESMKMEIPVICEEAGAVTAIHVSENDSVAAGQPLLDIQ